MKTEKIISAFNVIARSPVERKRIRTEPAPAQAGEAISKFRVRHNFIYSFVIISLTMFLFTGCMPNKSSADNDISPAPAANQDMSKRFQNAETGDATAVDSAIKLAQDHAILSEKMTQTHQQNQELIAENNKLKERIAALEPELAQTKKELEEANTLLIDMRIEINNWKTDVLGFRDELRQADKAQLETLLKILQVLGGEVNSPPSKVLDANKP
ncbi:MAG: hypothetical protein A2Y10_16230 [Planctomycetes bacterium GWF2_41_51]|nr:MAG: hypothetical protein A2Y10_16230 [Planctomycetes bacterium GWF2_41_51]HBG26580.1 hypothetical protein [Phycisphaerales bacterium]